MTKSIAQHLHNERGETRIKQILKYYVVRTRDNTVASVTISLREKNILTIEKALHNSIIIRVTFSGK